MKRTSTNLPYNVGVTGRIKREVSYYWFAISDISGIAQNRIDYQRPGWIIRRELEADSPLTFDYCPCRDLAALSIYKLEGFRLMLTQLGTRCLEYQIAVCINSKRLCTCKLERDHTWICSGRDD